MRYVDFVNAVDATLTAYEKIKGLKSRVYTLASLVPSPRAKNLMDAVKRHIPSAKITFKPDAKITEIVKSWPREFDVKWAQSELAWRPKSSSLDFLVSDFINEVRQHLDMYKVL